MTEAKRQQEHNIALVRKLFDSATNLDAAILDELLTPDFQMFSNDVQWDFQTFKDYHIESYKSRKSIEVTYHDIFCSNDRVAARVTIDLADNTDTKKQFEVILIVQTAGNRIHRLWEVTFPSWS